MKSLGAYIHLQFFKVLLVCSYPLGNCMVQLPWERIVITNMRRTARRYVTQHT